MPTGVAAAATSSVSRIASDRDRLQLEPHPPFFLGPCGCLAAIQCKAHSRCEPSCQGEDHASLDRPRTLTDFWRGRMRPGCSSRNDSRACTDDALSDRHGFVSRWHDGCDSPAAGNVLDSWGCGRATARRFNGTVQGPHVHVSQRAQGRLQRSQGRRHLAGQVGDVHRQVALRSALPPGRSVYDLGRIADRPRLSLIGKPWSVPEAPEESDVVPPIRSSWDDSFVRT
jgi:hypothetical protein